MKSKNKVKFILNLKVFLILFIFGASHKVFANEKNFVIVTVDRSPITYFDLKQKASKKNIKKFISHIAPCIEVVGYRQKKKGIKSLGDLCSDFGANVKFVIGPKKKFKNQN